MRCSERCARALAVLALGTPAALAAAPVAVADTLLTPLAGARNLAGGGEWLAWAQPSGDGRWRLALRSPEGIVSVPSIAPFAVPVQPKVGSDLTADGRLTTVVAYSRCARASVRTGCDVYRYDPAAGTERPVRGISTAAASETAPSVRRGVWAFVRRGAGVARPGVYVRSPGGRPRLLAPALATETVTTPGRVAFVHEVAGRPAIWARRISGRGPTVVLSAGEPVAPLGLAGTRYRFAWLRPAPGGMRVVLTARVSGDATTVALRFGDRLLPATALGLTTNDVVPDKYLDAGGIMLLDPRLRWGA